MTMTDDGLHSYVMARAVPAARATLPTIKFLLVRPLLGTIVKLAVDLIIAITAPVVIPWIPLINEFLDFVSDSKVSPAMKAQARDVLAFYRARSARVAPAVMYAVANPEPVGGGA